MEQLRNVIDFIVNFIRGNKEWLFSGIGVLILSLLVRAFLVRRKPHPTAKKFRGSLRITEMGYYNVFYPVKFDKIPNLTVSWKERKERGRFNLTEERPDGFVIRITRLPLISFGSQIRGGFTLNWQAWGSLAENK